MASKTIYFSVLHDNDAVCVLHTGNTLCNDQLCRFRDLGQECLPDFRVGCGIDSTCTVIQNQHLWFLQQCSCDTEALFLAEKRRTLFEAMEQMQKLEKERKEAEGRRNPLSESKNRLMEFGAEQKERLTEFGAEQKERFVALGFDVRSDKMPDLKGLLERFDQMTKPQLPTNWLMRLTTKRYLRAYPHLQGTHHASLKKEEKKVEEKEEKK